jgi:putative redox protein
MNGDVIVTEAAGGRYLNHVVSGRHRWLADEPESVGGTDAGPSPFRMLAAALGACTSMTLRMYAERKEWPLRRVEVAVSHERDGRLDRFVRTIAIDGELDDVQRAKLLDIANRCPVHRALEGSTEIVTTLA